MATGFIKTLQVDRGFAFIRPSDGRQGKDVFMHMRDLAPGLAWSEDLLNRDVEYEVRETEKGLRAFDVREVQP